VLLVHAFGHPYSPWSDFAASFRADLVKRSPEPIDLYEVSLDTARSENTQDERAFVDYIRALLSGRKPDLIVPVGAPAAFFVQRHRAELFPTSPMLILGADLRRIPGATLTENDTGVLLDLDLPAYIENILRLRPETTNVAVVVGNSPVERYWTGELQRAFQPFADQVKIEWFNDLTFDEMLKRAASMPSHYAIFWFLLSEDAAGVTYSQDRALESLRQVSAVPVFGMGDYELGRGIIGGPLMQTQKLGQEGADVALRILKGETPGGINAPYVLFGPPRYDWRELRRWNISERSLPGGGVVQFREPSVWQQYRWQIALIAAVILAQSFLIGYVLFQSRRRRAAEAEAAERRVEVMHLTRVAVLGELSGAIAHEINQPLTAILSNAQAALELLQQKSPNLAEIREAISDIVDEDNRAGEVITRLRTLLKKGEREVEQIDINDLVRSTIALLRSELISRRIEVKTDLSSSLSTTWGDSVQLQQVLLNLLMNAMDAMTSTPESHRQITIRSRVTQPNMLEVRIRDRGTGLGDNKADLFKPFYTSKTHGLGLGLSICSTIAQAHGGKVTLANHENSGAVAALSLPVTEILAVAAE
jgi:signal transduction histidine kinase